MKIAIIGAGPSGIIAAITIRQQSSHEVYLFDCNQKIGRKLFATGNGRCNILNMNANSEAYFSFRPTELKSVFEQVSPENLRDILTGIGIPTVVTEDGWVYPTSLSAANVVQILSDHLSSLGVKIFAGSKIQAIRCIDDQFRLESETAPIPELFDRLIISTGGKAFPQLGANTSILSELFQFGHYDIPFAPGLSSFSFRDKALKELQGVRLDAEVTLLFRNQPVGSSTGNIIFTDYGLNGPGVMDLSHLYDGKNAQGYALQINFLPAQMKTLLENAYYPHSNSPFPYRTAFLSVLPEKIVQFFFAKWNLDWDAVCRGIDARTFKMHERKLETFVFYDVEVRGFNYSQVAAGGIPLQEISLESMESTKKKGLFFTGEVLDVIGPCGGYNLFWAFATGIIAGNKVIGA